MPGSRTIKSLAALVMAMTLGTFALMLLDLKAEPLPSTVDKLAVISDKDTDLRHVLVQTDIPLQPLKWRNIIVHSSASPSSDLARGCHFLVMPGGDGRSFQVIATNRWKNQSDGQHVSIRGFDYNRNSIGVCLIGDFSSRPPVRQQFDVLVALTRQLRRHCSIPSDQVYLGRQLPLAVRTPGEAFPADLFEQLVRASLK